MSENEILVDEEDEDELPYLIFSVKSRFFAISTGQVREMLAVPETTHIPDAPDYVRGVINIRGNVYKLVDLRLRLGMQSHQQEMDELSENLDQRKAEHENWIHELETSVREDREFELEIDPHKCKFGRWYDSYDTSDSTVRMELKKFDKPHKAIHSTAGDVIELVQQGKKDEALEIIESRKNGELAIMIELFGSIKQLLLDTHREIAVIVELEKDSFALAVDKVEAVENIDFRKDAETAGMLEGFGGEFHGEIAQRKGSEQLLLLVEPAWIGGEAI